MDYRELLERLRRQVTEIGPGELAAAAPAVVIDIREPEELVTGTIPGALSIPRGNLEMEIERVAPDRSTPIVLFCSVGQRSLLAARALQELGYEAVASLAGGFTAWQHGGFPVQVSDRLTPTQRARYDRHLRIPDIGEEGQRRLMDASVIVVGAGGLGSPAALYLAAAGVGTIGIVDHDRVDLSNLQRQILHDTGDVGATKVGSAAATLQRLNPDVKVVTHGVRLSAGNAIELLSGYEVIVDASDNFPTRYVVNDAAVRLGIPVVHGSVHRFEGRLTVFPAGGRPCYRCLFAEAPPPELAPSCAEAGVLGAVPGVIGSLQAIEALKLVLGIGTGLTGRLVLYDAKEQRFFEVAVPPDPGCPVCAGDTTDVVLHDDPETCAG